MSNERTAKIHLPSLRPTRDSSLPMGILQVRIESSKSDSKLRVKRRLVFLDTCTDIPTFYYYCCSARCVSTLAA
jgi:hypothetical protein